MASSGDIRDAFGKQSANTKARAAAGTKRRALDTECWIEQGMLPRDVRVQFDALWNLHPEEHGTFSIMGKTVPLPRWQLVYLKPYNFSNVMHEAGPLPAEVQPLLDWANSMPHGPFNGAIVNWYKDGTHYIGPHRDRTDPLVPDSPVMSISLGANRVFRLKDFATKGRQVKVDVAMPNRSYLVMGGKMQERFTHEVPKITGSKATACGPRINITFRRFR